MSAPRISDAVQTVIREVGDIVSPIYLVGGSVRDIELGTEPKDYDFTTPLAPDDVEAAVRSAGRRPFITGKRFGTVGFKLGPHLIEITTFREESYRHGSRKPDVRFVSDITHDLSRRDFTINAMALRQDGRLVDPFGGRDDIAAGIIRTVGQAGMRFGEDPLRMLRAARFVSQLGFTADADTERRAGKRAADILLVSKERWVQELDKLLLGDRAAQGLDFLARTRLLHFMLPELGLQVGFDQDSPYHELDLWGHTLRTVSLIDNDLTLRWAALLHDVGKPFVQVKNRKGYSNYQHHDLIGAGIVHKTGMYLKWSKERTAAVEVLVRDHLHEGSPLQQADSAARSATGGAK